MFAGHVGAALAIGRAERRVNIGVLVFAALWLDFALWLFVLLGFESVTIPADFAGTHQPRFVFPYSHGLLASVGWCALALAAVWLCRPRLRHATARVAAFAAAAVFSHWLLDALVHAPELPLAGDNSTKVGFGLWQIMPAALALEGAIAIAGLYLFLGRSELSRARKISLATLTLLILVLTVAGMTVAPAPPSIVAMAATSLATIGLTAALFAWIGRPAATNRQAEDR